MIKNTDFPAGERKLCVGTQEVFDFLGGREFILATSGLLDFGKSVSFFFMFVAPRRNSAQIMEFEFPKLDYMYSTESVMSTCSIFLLANSKTCQCNAN